MLCSPLVEFCLYSRKHPATSHIVETERALTFVSFMSRPLYPRERKPRWPYHRCLGGLQDRSGRYEVQKTLCSYRKSDHDFPIVQPVPDHYMCTRLSRHQCVRNVILTYSLLTGRLKVNGVRKSFRPLQRLNVGVNTCHTGELPLDWSANAQEVISNYVSEKQHLAA